MLFGQVSRSSIYLHFKDSLKGGTDTCQQFCVLDQQRMYTSAECYHSEEHKQYLHTSSYMNISQFHNFHLPDVTTPHSAYYYMYKKPFKPNICTHLSHHKELNTTSTFQMWQQTLPVLYKRNKSGHTTHTYMCIVCICALLAVQACTSTYIHCVYMYTVSGTSMYIHLHTLYVRYTVTQYCTSHVAVFAWEVMILRLQ